MQHDDRVYVGHMLDLARRIGARVAGLDRSGFDTNEDLQLALTHLVQTFGEAARRVSREYQDSHPVLPWPAIVGMRHKVVHDYLDVDLDLVWEVVTLEVPRLIAALERLVEG